MKSSILISIKPKWVAKILNGEKTIEIRKTAPKCDLPIEVYIYCTKKGGLMRDVTPVTTYFISSPVGPVTSNKSERLEGKVVAKFVLKKVESVPYWEHINPNDMEQTSLTWNELYDYVGDRNFYAWHISDLVIFDEPKTIWQMKFFSKPKKVRQTRYYNVLESKQISKAPQSWCYVEVME